MRWRWLVGERRVDVHEERRALPWRQQCGGGVDGGLVLGA
jgi:hypothetical protein